MLENIDYVAKKIPRDFQIDGDVEKEIWREATWSRSFIDMATGEASEFQTKSAILWSERYLYVAFDLEEPEIQAKITERDALIFLENDVELFIDGGECYYELEINALNTVYEVFFIWRDSFPDNSRFPPETFDIFQDRAYTFGGDYDRSGEHFWVGTHPRGVRWAFRDFDLPSLQTAVFLNGTLNDSTQLDKGWSVEIAIPWSSLAPLAGGRSLPPAEGDIWKLFLGRFQKKIVAGKELSPHPASALNSHGIYDTHQPERWSAVLFQA